MDIKVAIEWIRTLTNCLNYPANFNFKEPKELAENNRKANNVIIILQRGEENKKYKTMWYGFRSKRGDTYTNANREQVKDMMNDFEYKYFPKGVNDNGQS